jgi:hypothetical protein
MTGWRGSLVVALVALTAIGAAGIAAAGAAEYVTIGWGISLKSGFTLAPRVLSKTESTPASAFLEGRVISAEGTHPPALRQLQIGLDRNIDVNVEGLPTCHFSVEGPRNPGTQCRNALVGTGKAHFEIAFPEGNVRAISSRLLVFNGGARAGVATLLIRAYITVPVPASIVTTMKFRRIHEGRYGLLATGSIPKIAGGNGSVTSFSLKIDKKFTYKGKKVSVLSAKCPDGKLQARVAGLFADGTFVQSESIRPCTAKG